jgi:isoquinoline 1-oxidoreductase subunit beta
MSSRRLGRRALLEGGLVLGAGLVVGVELPLGRAAGGAETDAVFAPNAWVRIDAQGAVTIVVAKSEMGQGSLTSMAVLVAEELEAEWSTVRIQSAPVDPAYRDAIEGVQATTGDTSVRGSWLPLRQAGAAAREMLVTAAALEWGVPPESCSAEQGVVWHRATGRRLAYGLLAEKAAKLPVPPNPRLKDPGEFRLIGRPVPRLDIPAKVDGSAVFGLDVRLPGLLFATVARCPVFGGTVASLDASRANAVKGVRAVVQIPSGVAVVADAFWPAKLGRQALDIKWSEGPNRTLSSAAITRALRAAAARPGAVARREGDPARALAGAAHRLEATYQVPFLAHATMEPQTCTVHVRADGCDVWVPTQHQEATRDVVATITGLPPAAVRVHTTLLGGGFGRRSEVDFVDEAAHVAKATGAPVQVVWTREDDIRHDLYRAATLSVLRAGLDRERRPVAWTQHVVGPSILGRLAPEQLQKGIDVTSLMGATSLPYAIPNLEVQYTRKETGVPVGYWRSVGESYNPFMTECFLDEVAAASGRDPVELRRELLVGQPRYRGVLDLAAARAGWGTPLGQGRGRGIALHGGSFGSYLAQVAEVAVAKDGSVCVERVVCTIDCGIVVNPDTVTAQMEGGIVFGLSAVLKGAITIERGRVQQSNFHDYPLLRMHEVPVIEVHIVPSTEPPGGVGESGVAPVAPAVCNAIFAATGRRVRQLPIRPEALRRA